MWSVLPIPRFLVVEGRQDDLAVEPSRWFGLPAGCWLNRLFLLPFIHQPEHQKENCRSYCQGKGHAEAQENQHFNRGEVEKCEHGRSPRGIIGSPRVAIAGTVCKQLLTESFYLRFDQGRPALGITGPGPGSRRFTPAAGAGPVCPGSHAVEECPASGSAGRAGATAAAASGPPEFPPWA